MFAYALTCMYIYIYIRLKSERERERAYGACLLFFTIFALQLLQQFLLKIVHVLGFKLLPSIAVTTGTATIGRGVAACEALLLAVCAHWLRPC